jgi:hypothetical protein
MLSLMLLVSCAMFSTEIPVKNAERWATGLGYTVKGVSCSNRDSDGDGYVSCSLRADGPVFQLECAYMFPTGCREAPLPGRLRQ